MRAVTNSPSIFGEKGGLQSASLCSVAPSSLTRLTRGCLQLLEQTPLTPVKHDSVHTLATYSQHTPTSARTTQSWTTTKKQTRKNGISISRASKRVRSTTATRRSRKALQEALIPLRNMLHCPGRRHNELYNETSLSTNL